MKDFFEFVGKGYEGEITLDPIERIIPIILSFVIILLLFIFTKTFKSWKYQDTFRKFLGYFLFVVWLAYFLWYIIHGEFGSKSLPISLCSLTSMGFIYVFITNNKRVLDVVFYWGIVGGLLAMLFVGDVYRGVDHFRYYQFYLDHMLIFIAPFYFMFAYKYVPTIKSTIISFVSLLIAALLTLPVNLAYQMDYMIMNPYNPPVGTPAADIANLVNNNLLGYIGVLILLGSIVYGALYLLMYVLSHPVRKSI